MRTAKQPFTLAKGRRLRVTRLDSCGRVVYGDDATVVSDGFVSVAATPNTTETDEINVQNANGRPIIFEAGTTSLSGYGLELVFAEVDPELFSIITGQRVILDADGNPVGFAINSKVDLSAQGYALEIWAGAPGGDACADEEAEGSYGYFLFPFLQGGILGDHTIENGGITFTITGANTQDGNAWGKGPYDVTLNLGEDPGDPKVAGPLIDALDPNDHELVIPVQVAPPAAVWGSRPLLDPSITALVSVTATPDATLEVDFAVLADPAADVGVWYDFGDDTWDFVVNALGNTSHTYAVAGEYTVRASTNGVWVEDTFTVPTP